MLNCMDALLAVSAADRFHGMRNINSSDSIWQNKWFVASMAVILAGSVIALIVVNVYKKVAGYKKNRISFIEQRTQNPERRTEDGGLPVEAAAKAGQKVENNSLSSVVRHPSSEIETAVVAIFPFTKEISLPDAGNKEQLQQEGAPSPPGEQAKQKQHLPDFSPAIVTGLVGRVVFLETTLKANVGDSVFVVIGPVNSEKGDGLEIYDAIGRVEQSQQPAALLNEPDARRLGIVLTGINDTQAARLGSIVGQSVETGKVV
jgi:hypothetical protein